MNLLIVDDQAPVVQGLLGEIDWKSIGIDNCFGAYSALEAQEYLLNNSIDILLSDIEMPVESGISLVKWIRNKQLDVCVILLSAYAKFTYAQEAVNLDVYEYILQPAPYVKIADSVAGAVQWVQVNRTKKQLSEYGQEYVRKEGAFVNMALWSWLNGKQNRQEIQTLAEQDKLPTLNGDVYIALVSPTNSELTAEWEADVFTYALQNIIAEIFMPYSQRVAVVTMAPDEYAVFIWGDQCSLSLSAIQRQLGFFQQMFQRYFGSGAAVYYSCQTKTEYSCDAWKELQILKRDNVSGAPVLQNVDQVSAPNPHRFYLPQIKDWYEKLQGEYPQSVEKEAIELLDKITAEGKMNARTLRDFCQEFVRMLYLAIDHDASFWSETIEEGENYEIYRNAELSTENMKQFIHLAVDYVCSQVEPPEKELMQKIDAYIERNMAEEIRRNDLAQHVFLNPDYLNRIVKRSTGYSLKEYATRKKLDMARHLLRTTRLPVNIIAARVGFAQVSYFSASYKKQFGYTPMQERKDDAR